MHKRVPLFEQGSQLAEAEVGESPRLRANRVFQARPASSSGAGARATSSVLPALGQVAKRDVDLERLQVGDRFPTQRALARSWKRLEALPAEAAAT